MKCADIVVVGGGIAGLGVAAMLSDSARVVVLEQESQCGYHTSGRSAAMHIPGYGPPAVRRLTRASKDFLSAPPERFGAEPMLSPRGDMMIARTGEEHFLEELLEDSTGHEEISVADALKLVPVLQSSSISRVAMETDAHDIDVDRLLQAFRRRLKRDGGTVELNALVTGLAYKAGLWQVTTSAGEISAPILVNAAGAWGDHIAALAQVSAVGLLPCRRSAALLPAPDVPGFLHWPLFASVRENWYARPMAGRLMVSPADEDLVDPHDAFADDLRLAEGLHQFEQMVSLSVERVEHSWGGLRTFSTDGEPVVGFAVDNPNFFWLVGQGGYGIQTAPALSRLAADLVLGQVLDTDDAALASLLSPARFRADNS